MPALFPCRRIFGQISLAVAWQIIPTRCIIKAGIRDARLQATSRCCATPVNPAKGWKIGFAIEAIQQHRHRWFLANSKDRVSREITGPFVKCKIRNASREKWNKPRHTGVGGVAGVAAVARRLRSQRKRDARGKGNLLRVRLCVSFISTDIIMALRGRS